MDLSRFKIGEFDQDSRRQRGRIIKKEEERFGDDDDDWSEENASLCFPPPQLFNTTSPTIARKCKTKPEEDKILNI